MTFKQLARREKKIFKTFGGIAGIQFRFLKGSFTKDVNKYIHHKKISKGRLRI